MVRVCVVCKKNILHGDAANYLRCGHDFHRSCLVAACEKCCSASARIYCSLCRASVAQNDGAKDDQSDARDEDEHTRVSPVTELRILGSELVGSVHALVNTSSDVYVNLVMKLVDEMTLLTKVESFDNLPSSEFVLDIDHIHELLRMTEKWCLQFLIYKSKGIGKIRRQWKTALYI